MTLGYKQCYRNGEPVIEYLKCKRSRVVQSLSSCGTTNYYLLHSIWHAVTVSLQSLSYTLGCRLLICGIICQQWWCHCSVSAHAVPLHWCIYLYIPTFSLLAYSPNLKTATTDFGLLSNWQQVQGECMAVQLQNIEWKLEKRPSLTYHSNSIKWFIVLSYWFGQ